MKTVCNSLVKTQRAIDRHETDTRKDRPENSWCLFNH